MIRILTRAADGAVRTDLDLEGLEAARASDPELLIWLDCQPTPQELPALEVCLREEFGFHPVAIEDALQEVHLPKLNDWVDYVYMVLHVDRLKGKERELKTLELDVFLGPRFLITHHGDPSPMVDEVWERAASEPQLAAHGAGYLLHMVLDGVVEAHGPLVEKFQEWIDEAEEDVLADPRARTLESILDLRRALLTVRRNLRGMEQAVGRLSKKGLAVVSAEDRIYFRDVLDNLMRQAESLDQTRDMIAGTMDTYLSVTSNRTNEIMYILTLVTALFLPISFLAGFFGMNFFGPEFTIHFGEVGRPLFYGTMGAMVMLPVTMVLAMRWRGWL